MQLRAPRVVLRRSAARGAAAGLVATLFLGAPASPFYARPARATPPAPRSYHVEVAQPERSALSLLNATREPIVVRPVSFGGFPVLHSLADVATGVALLPGEYPDFSDATRIFRYVADNFFHAWPLSADYSWAISPTLFFNSLGKSLCGDAANLIVHLATRRALPARRWALQGHVVAEVFDGGKWKMYDADYGVYFVNRIGEIASVAELEADPDLIVNPLYRMQTHGKWSPYTIHYAGLFSTLDNRVAGHDPIGFPAEAVELTLPRRGRAVFFGRYAPAPIAYDGAPWPNYGNLKLVLPPGFSGEVDVFLILHAIQGRGEVSLDGESFAIGSPELEAAIAADRSPAVQLRVVEAHGPVAVVYLMSPLRYELSSETTLAVEGAGGQQLEIVELGVAGADSDSDGVADDGDGSGIASDAPCRSLATTGCDDNCTFAANAGQEDLDDDRAGNACDGDLDQTGFVDDTDRQVVETCALLGWGTPGPPEDPVCTESDLTGDRQVEAADLERLDALAFQPPRPGEMRVGVAAPQGCGSGFAVAWLPVLAGWRPLQRLGRRTRA